jgi:hypothetical protein
MSKRAAFELGVPAPLREVGFQDSKADRGGFNSSTLDSTEL